MNSNPGSSSNLMGVNLHQGTEMIQREDLNIVTLEPPEHVYDNRIDPTYVVTLDTFKLTPLVVQSQDRTAAVSYTLVNDNEAQENDRPNSSRRGRVKSGHKDRVPTSLGLYSASTSSMVGSPAIDDDNEDGGAGSDFDVLDDVLVLSCEWDDCDADIVDLNEFMSHVRGHVNQGLQIFPCEGDEGEIRFGCRWQDCFFESDNESEAIRHTHYHTFHTNIKSIGTDIVRKTGVSSCKQDSTQRNMLPELSEPFRCQWIDCQSGDTDFPEAIKYYWHVTWHSEENKAENQKEKSFPCRWKGCTAKPNSLSKLKEHLRSHSQERLVGCPICGGLFANRSKFFDHCKRQAPAEDLNYKCSYCNKHFALERLLRDHMRQHINQFKCPECDMTSPTPSALAAHMAYRHTTEKNFACTETGCDYRAKVKTDLLAHVKTVHWGENDFRCSTEGCSFRCKSKMTLKHHTDRVHHSGPPRYCCHICNKRFGRGNYLTKHLISQHKIRWPSGHTRFRYRQDDEGLFHLQTIRFESFELRRQETGLSSGVQDDETEEAVDDPDEADFE